MALFAKHKNTEFGVGDVIRVTQVVEFGEKKQTHVFEGMVISIKGRDNGKSFVVRRIGVQQIGIEKIFPLNAPTIENVEVVKKGLKGVRQAKLYYTRGKSRREIEKIYSRAKRQEAAESVKEEPKSNKKVKSVSKDAAKKPSKKK